MIDLKALIEGVRINDSNRHESRAASVIAGAERTLESKITLNPRDKRWSTYIKAGIGENKQDFELFYNYLITHYVIPGKTQMCIEFIRPDDREAIYDHYILFSIS